MDNTALVITLIFGFATTIVVSIIVPIMSARYRRQEKVEDWARQDAVAAEVKAAATQTAKAAKLLVESNAEVAAAAKDSAANTSNKLEVLDAGQKEIHVLVNSAMSAAKKSELIALEAQLVLMGEVIGLKRDTGKEPTVQAIAKMESLKARIGELTVDLADRAANAALAAKQKAAT